MKPLTRRYTNGAYRTVHILVLTGTNRTERLGSYPSRHLEGRGGSFGIDVTVVVVVAVFDPPRGTNISRSSSSSSYSSLSYSSSTTIWYIAVGTDIRTRP